LDFRHVEDLARTLARASSRRDILRGLAGAGLGLAIARPSLPVEARKRRKRKTRKPRKPRTPQATPNAFGCLNVGDPCTGPGECCSGICEGTQGGRTCRAHHTGDCPAGIEIEGCGGTEISCSHGDDNNGVCSTTTGNAGYCLLTADCYPCKTDFECQRAKGGFFGPTAACITCTACDQTSGTACALAYL
jgi:hypothetical protein